MREYFEKYNFSANEKQIEKFEKFKDLLLFYNKEFNITSITDEKEIFIKHFFDSASAVDNFKKNSTVIEIGSGGGFPSVPLKIMREDLSFTLVEATGKKCKFLNEIKKELGFDNFEILNERAEVLGKNENFREKYDYSTARAVARLNALSEYCIPFIKVGGSFIALKGIAEEEINEAQNAVKILGCKLGKVKEYDLPENFGKRTIIEIVKIKSTDKKYPRGNGKERSKPL